MRIRSTFLAGAFLVVILLFGAACAGQTEAPSELDRWIGQMLMVGFRGTELPPGHPFLDTLEESHLGGVVLFDYDVPSRSPLRNIESAQQVRALTQALQEATPDTLFIAIDQEGGKVTRLKSSRGFPETYSHQYLGQQDSEPVTRQAAAEMAETLSQLGINLNLAPVVDLNLNPDNPIIGGLERSFGADPDKVVEQAGWMIDEFHKKGVLSCLKHFPGHGSSRQDSHLGLTDVTRDWQALELEPFRRLIQQGRADAVMTAHLFNSNWDSEKPATLAPGVIQTLLRDEMGFEGVVISDDMQMGAIVEHFSFERSLRLAIDAGVDILVISNNQQYDETAPQKAHSLIRNWVLRGEIPAERIRQSFQRIQELKAKIGSD